MSKGTTYEQRQGHKNLCTARRQDGKPCGRYAVRGATVCRVHGGAAPQVVAAAKRRLQQATDALAAKLLGIALDEGASESVRLQAIKDALDRGGVIAKQNVDVAVELRPYEHLLNDIAGVANITREESRARRGLPPDEPPALAELAEVLDAEIVDPPDSRASHDGAIRERDDRGDVPADRPATRSGPPNRALVPLEEATADAAAANRAAARIARVRRVR